MNRKWVRSCVCTMRRNMCSQPATKSTTGAAAEPSTISTGGTRPDGMVSPLYKPSAVQKFTLVWTKKFKSKADIPNLVSPDLIERANSQARIKVANILMALTVLASIGAILSGKAAAKRGESVHQINQDFHKQYEENYKKQQETATAPK